MATREEYNACMKPYMTGSKPKEQRQLDFCVGAKLCSGKAKDEKEAERVCLLPKPPKEEKERKRREVPTCNVEQIVSCLIDNLDTDADDVEAALRKAVSVCVCDEKPKRRSKTQEKKDFLKQYGFEDK